MMGNKNKCKWATMEATLKMMGNKNKCKWATMEAGAGATRRQFYPLSCSFLTAQNYIQLNFTKITSN